MKKLLLLLMIVLTLTPAVSSWVPHGIVHVLHDTHARHHQRGYDLGEHYSADHAGTVAHEINADIVTYFQDYMHVDLLVTDHNDFVLQSQKFQNAAFDAALGGLIHQLHLTAIKSRAPPHDMAYAALSPIPLYLSTQRFRI